METITIDGREYRVTIEPDYDCGAPWDEECGYGPVTDWTSRAKEPGELVLCTDRGSYRYYDFAGACRIAKRDGWSTAEIEARKAQGEKITAKEQAARAARADYKRLRDWCNDRWHYVGVVVSDEEGESTSLWGIESDADAYLEEVARELAEDLHKNWKERRRRECLMAYEG